MRTFGLALGVTVAASFLAPSQLLAQRNVRRSTSAVRVPEQPAPAHPSATTRSSTSSARHCISDCGDYSLAIVSAVMPSETAHTASAASDVVTLVIENRGTIDAPVSMVSVAPRNHLSLARQTAIPALAPGQRTTIQLPVATADDGTQCVSITITPSPVADPATARFLAAAIPDPDIRLGSFGDLASAGFGAGLMGEMPWSKSIDSFASFRSPDSW
jgi:hypothetical protein